MQTLNPPHTQLVTSTADEQCLNHNNPLILFQTLPVSSHMNSDAHLGHYDEIPARVKRVCGFQSMQSQFKMYDCQATSVSKNGNTGQLYQELQHNTWFKQLLVATNPFKKNFSDNSFIKISTDIYAMSRCFFCVSHVTVAQI